VGDAVRLGPKFGLSLDIPVNANGQRLEIQQAIHVRNLVEHRLQDKFAEFPQPPLAQMTAAIGSVRPLFISLFQVEMQCFI
jgi:hypothetical protein